LIFMTVPSGTPPIFETMYIRGRKVGGGADWVMRLASSLCGGKIYTIAKKSLGLGDEWHYETNMKRYMYDGDKIREF
jgi:hypothetical protein